MESTISRLIQLHSEGRISDAALDNALTSLKQDVKPEVKQKTESQIARKRLKQKRRREKKKVESRQS